MVKSKMTIIVKFFLLGVLIGYEVGYSTLLVAPNNTATVSGEQLLLQCRTTGNESFVREWTVVRYYSDQSGRNSEPKLIFSHWENDALYTISPDFSHFGAVVDASGSAVLYTNSSKIDDAGLYTCLVEVKKTTFRYSAHVVILQTTPKCEANFKSDDFLTKDFRIWMRCTVEYRGNMAPILQWKRHQQDTDTSGKVVTEGLQANTVAGSNISSTLTIVASPSEDDIYYSCTIFFTSYDSSNFRGASMVAGNAPDYSYTWASPVVRGQSPTTHGFNVYAMGRNSEDATQTNKSTNWFVISLALGAGLLGVFIIMAAITAALCYRMKRTTLQGEKETTVKTEEKSEETQDTLMSKEASSQRIRDDCENYEYIGDVIQEYDALNRAYSDNPCPEQESGYGDLLPTNQRENSAYFKIYHQNKPVQYRRDLTGPAKPGLVDYLDLQYSDFVGETPVDTSSQYLALVRDSGIVQPTVEI